MSGFAKNSAAMSAARCTCGYEAVDADDLGDHFLEVLTPADDRDTKGIVHAEAAGPEPTRACLCGFAAAGITELDAHFIAVFTPASRNGPDGVRHAIARAVL